MSATIFTALDVSFPDMMNVEFFEGCRRMSNMSSMACLICSSGPHDGIGIVDGTKVTVSVIRSVLVLGIYTL